MRKYLNTAMNFFRSPQFRKTAITASEVYEAVKPAIESQTPRVLFGSALSVVKIFAEKTELIADLYFLADEWEEMYVTDFTPTVMSIISTIPIKRTIKTSSQNTVVRMIEINGVDVGWLWNSVTESIVNDIIYCRCGEAEKAKAGVKALMWKKFGDRPIVMKYVKKHGNMSSNVALVHDTTYQSITSQKATEISTYLKRALDAGIKRSLMLYGPPGTGKSTMARTIITNLGLKSFRVKVEDLNDTGISLLYDMISALEPDAIILDDFDRVYSQAALLELLEFFQKNVKLLIATVNNKENLDDAILRPGRFDELVLVSDMDEQVVKHILGEYSDGYDIVKTWPIAFINEYVQRRRFMDESGAAASMQELANRVKQLDKYTQDDTWSALEVKRTKKSKPKTSSRRSKKEADATLDDKPLDDDFLKKKT